MTVNYTKTTWANDSAPYLNETNLNNIETGIENCANEINTHEADIDIHFSALERTKLSGIEPGAQVNPTATELLASIKTVDGAASGLDADTLDGNHASAFVLASEISNYLNKVTDTLDDIPDGTTYVKSENNFTDTLLSKLNGIESSATADMTGSEIVTAINASVGILDDARIAASIARDIDVTSAISSHAAITTAHHSNSNDPTSDEKAAMSGAALPSATNVFATMDDMASAGVGDMLKSIYDSNDDGKVNSADSADAVPWTGITGKPTEFTPESHTQLASTITDFDTEVSNNTDVAANTTHRALSNNPHSVTLEQLLSGASHGDVIYFNGTSWTKLAAGTSGNYLKTQGAAANPLWAAAPSTELSEDTTPVLGGNLDCSSKNLTGAKVVTTTAEHDNGNSSTAITIDQNNGNYQKLTLTAACSITLTGLDCAGLSLRLVQDGTGSRTVTWVSTIKWAGGSAPTLSTAAGAEDIITLQYRNGAWYGGASLGFS
ncbi:hypothetical protein V7O66_13770 [Methanolobus sp. ZRKC3]|uniref:hypothetical protein n=1 Tax=Methanolobus sp. ZRKC3 TaxID=3125786 RepID=UPI0032488CD9